MMFAQVAEKYPKYMSLNARAIRVGNQMQQQLLDRATLVTVASSWARNQAQRSYKLVNDNVVVAPFGANLPNPPDIEEFNSSRPLRMLFVGADWHRKGGAMALKVFQLIRIAYPDAELHIAGCQPREATGVPGVVVHGHLSRSDPDQRQRLLNLFRNASYFLMPSRQEAYGIVYCEACAFGIPPIGTAVGGVSEIIQDGVNGILLSADALPDAYVSAALAVWRDPQKYQAMRRAARVAYETRLNWDAWGETFERELSKRLSVTPRQ
jgi:glycosyltransferase involved in cell wall biosynthesis